MVHVKSRGASVVLLGLFLISVGFWVFGRQICAASEKKPILLRYSEISPPKGTRPNSVMWWKEQVETRTQGKVKIEIYWSQSLLKGKENIHGVGQGVADLGYCAPQYNPSELPLWTFISAFPFAERSLDEVYKAKWALYGEEPALKEELKKKNLTLVSIFPYDFYTLWTRRARVQSLEDLKGLKLRVSSEGHGKILEAVGCASVFMPAGDIYTAVQKGTVDGMIFPLEHTFAYGLHEVVKYGVDAHILGITALLAMNMDTWNRLPPDVQEIMAGTGKDLSFHLLRGIEKDRADTAKKVQAAGVEMYEFPKSELKKWAALPEIKNLKTKWIKEKEERGLPAKRVIDRFVQLME